MKRIIRNFAVDTFTLFIIANSIEGIVFDEGIKTLLIAGAALMLSSYVVKPVINLLLLPINLLTFNFFKWLSSAAAIYIVLLVVKGFHINEFFFPGFTSNFLDLPAISLTGFIAIVTFSFTFSILGSIIYWIIS